MSRKRNGAALPFNPPFAFCIFDRFLRFVMASPMLAKLAGYSVEELSLMGAAEITSLESMEVTLHSLDQVDQSGWSHHELHFFRRDGFPVTAHVDTIPLEADQYLSIFTQLRFQPIEFTPPMDGRKLNCWEAMACGRQPGGSRTCEFGPCPAATIFALDGMNSGLNAGRACWAVAGTLCQEQAGASPATKIHDCRACSFYQAVMKEEGPRFAGRLEILSRLDPG